MENTSAEPWMATAVAAAEDDDGGGGVAAGPSRNQIIRWERFLPRKTIRLLLVEPDDSTRHIVAALLRKCSYQVAAVGDGMKAWELMIGNRFEFDLVLTEVSMPSLSGIGLLSKIVATQQCKDIPVIMMSSQDSVGVVLKCMLKGAVDFLVKPVRKNELRNLWQHVWRRHCSGSNEISDNNAASNHLSANEATISVSGENSKGSDVQSLGSKQEDETQSVRKIMEPVTHEGNRLDREMEDRSLPDDYDMRVDSDHQLRGCSEGTDVESDPVLKPSLLEDKQLKTSHKSSSFSMESLAYARHESFCIVPQPTCQNRLVVSQGVAGCSVPVAHGNTNFHVQEDCILKEDMHESKSGPKETGSKDCSPSQLLELSLSRPQFNGSVSQELKERCTLNRSHSSAFSRYGKIKAHPPSPKHLPPASVMTTETSDRYRPHSPNNATGDRCTVSLPAEEHHFSPKDAASEYTVYAPALPNVGTGSGFYASTTARNDISVAPSTEHGSFFQYHHPSFMAPAAVHIGAIPCDTMYSGIGGLLLRPVFHLEAPMLPSTSGAAIDATTTAIDLTTTVSSDRAGHISDDLQSIPFHHPEETTVGAGVAMAQVNEAGLRSHETIDGSPNMGGGIGQIPACDRSRRAVALQKFRLKRKDRCFEKKVRYYSRKKLAEQRPRVKGQFVSQKNQVMTEAEEER